MNSKAFLSLFTIMLTLVLIVLLQTVSTNCFAIKQSELMLLMTQKPWSKQLESTLDGVNFKAYNLDRENPSISAKQPFPYILVNKSSVLGEDFVPSDLIKPNVNYVGASGNDLLIKEIVPFFENLISEARSQGYIIFAVSAYRSIAYQKNLYNSYVAQYGSEKTDTFSAKPGRSEHHTGLAVDVSSPVMNYGLDVTYDQTEEGNWLKHNAHRFGFSIRYLKGKEPWTGYMYEPWHLRYFGVELASYLYDTNLSFEEFIFLQTNHLPAYIQLK